MVCRYGAARNSSNRRLVRRRIKGLPLRPGDVIQIVGNPDHGDPAALDYLKVTQLAP
jgi:hypothetical protein